MGGVADTTEEPKENSEERRVWGEGGEEDTDGEETPEALAEVEVEVEVEVLVLVLVEVDEMDEKSDE